MRYISYNKKLIKLNKNEMKIFKINELSIASYDMIVIKIARLFVVHFFLWRQNK